MAFLSELYLPGALTLWCALIFGVVALWGYARNLAGDETAGDFARRAYTFFALSIALASLVLLVALLRRDFRIEYIFQYSGLDLATHYQLAAFWAGQKGSFLIWLFWGALIGIPLARTTGKNEAPVMAIYTLTLLGLLFILVRESPFVMLDEAPVDGKGLNPLLQDDWMVIHPPIMFIGYSLGAVPFAFAAAAMWRRDFSTWAARAFPWTLAAFVVLGTAILMGGYWAYKTLGWGGFWGWDPVENASLIPWLLSTALIHGLHLERTKGRYRRLNLVLACLIFLSVLYGTFLTRSGVLADFSVHSFVELGGLSTWLLSILLIWSGTSVFLLATRLRNVDTGDNVDPFLSRGTAMVMGTIALLISAVVVTVGTSAPLLTGFLENPGQVGPEWYNTVNLPIALLIALLLASVPFLTWRSNDAGKLLRKLAPATALGLLVTVGAGVAAVRDPFHLLYIFLAAVALFANLHKTIELVRSGGLRVAGGYLTHVGVGVILLGVIASTGYDQSAKVTLSQGTPLAVRDLTLTFERFVNRGELPEACGEKECLEITIERADGRTETTYPKLFINDRTRQLMVNPAIRNSLTHDLYISPIEYDPGIDPRQGQTLQLAQGETAEVGPATVRFLGFDLNVEGNALAQLQQGGLVAVGAVLEFERDGERERVTPVYRFVPNQEPETPMKPLASGGGVALTGINATDSAVRLHVAGLIRPEDVVPPKIAIDVTEKPLIQLVWWGMYVVFLGGALATVQRFRDSRRLKA